MFATSRPSTPPPLAAAAALALAAGLLLAAAPAAAGEDGGERHRVRIHRLGGPGAGHEMAHVPGFSRHGFHHDLHPGRAFLGVQLTPLTPELRTHFGVPEDVGVLVARVVEESPALAAGLEVGDVIAAVDGEPVARPGELARAVGGREAGDAVTLEVWREGAVSTLTATLAEPEAPFAPSVHRRLRFDCEEGEECGPGLFFLRDLPCGEGEECEVEVTCGDDGCECVVDGESVDCGEAGLARPRR